MMKINFRIADINDLPRLAEINSFGEASGKEEALRELPKFIEHKNLLCAEVDAQIVGLLYWEEKFFGRGNWFITQITVDESWRRKGIGESLWRHFLDIAKNCGAQKVYCDIRASNLPSLNLAKKMGAFPAGNLDVGDDDPRLFYRIDLDRLQN